MMQKIIETISMYLNVKAKNAEKKELNVLKDSHLQYWNSKSLTFE